MTEKITSTTGESINQDEEKLRERAEKIFREIEHNPAIQFFVVGIGNVINTRDARGADGKGAFGYIFDHSLGRMMNEPGAHSDEMLLTKSFDNRTSNLDAYFDWKFDTRIIRENQCISLTTRTTGGSEHSKLIRDKRAGTFTFGLRMPANIEIADLSNDARQLLSEPRANEQMLGNILKRFCWRHIPEYSKEIALMQRHYDEYQAAQARP